MATLVAAGFPLIIATMAVLLSLWQNVLQRRALQAQVFLKILEQSLSSDVANGINTLMTLAPYSTFSDYQSAESEATQDAIFRLVDFLNNTASLVEQGLIPRQKVWDVYFWAYRIAYQKLVPWWLDGIREQSWPQRLSAFARMGGQAARISDDAIARFDAKRRLQGHSAVARMGNQMARINSHVIRRFDAQ